MAFVSMDCNCGASFQYETENESRLDLMSEAFRNAHSECNYMTQYARPNEVEKMHRYDITYKEPREKEL
jgi:hypothetical protein